MVVGEVIGYGITVENAAGIEMEVEAVNDILIGAEIVVIDRCILV